MTHVQRAMALIAACMALGASAPSGGGVVPAERCGDFFLLHVRTGDADGPLRMLLDTRSRESLLDPDALQDVASGPVRKGFPVSLPDASAGPLRFEDLQVTVRQLDHLRYTIGTPVDGILGWPAFLDVLLTVDYLADEIRVEPGPLPAVDHETVFPLRERAAPHLAVQFAGRDTISLVLDTASTFEFLVRHGSDVGAWESEPRPIGLQISPRQVERQEAGRVAGDVAFGPATLHRPIVHLTDGEDIAGTGVLRHFTVTFDLRQRRVRFERRTRKPIRFDSLRTTGLLLGPYQGQFRVVGVLEGTPAESADVERGDVVLAVDGVDVNENRCTPRRKRKRHVYTLEDGETTRELSLPEVVLIP